MTDILMVEDERELAGLLRIYMEKAGYTVRWAASGEEALDCLRRDTVKMLLLDITLPGMDGFAVCREVRKTDSVRADLSIVRLPEHSMSLSTDAP